MHYAWPFEINNEECADDLYCTANCGFAIGESPESDYEKILTLYKASLDDQGKALYDECSDNGKILPGFRIIPNNVHEVLDYITQAENGAEELRLNAIRKLIIEKCSISTVLPVQSC